MIEAVSFARLAVTHTFDSSADDSERRLACIGFDAYSAGRSPDEAVGPEPPPTPDDGDDFHDPLPFPDPPDSDAGDWLDEPRSLGELRAVSGTHQASPDRRRLPMITRWWHPGA